MAKWPLRRSGEANNGSSPWETMTSFNEAFRILGANISAALNGLEQPSVVVTSSQASEGKTVTCCKLAVSFAARGKRVVVVDLDLRRPTIHALLGVRNHVGVTDVLRGRRELGDSLQYVQLPGGDGLTERGLFVVAGGAPVDEPVELLSQPRAKRMLESLAAQADIVLVDSPPVLAVADTLTIGTMVGAAILVVDTRRTNADTVTRSRDLLTRNHTRVLGLALNQVRASDASVSASTGYGYGKS